MKLTSKDKLIQESYQLKVAAGRQLKAGTKYLAAIEAYHKALFLKEDSTLLVELAEIYEELLDITSALLFYRRANQLNTSVVTQQKIKQLSKVQGMQLLEVGSVNNILQDTSFQPFIKRYSLFHQLLLKRVQEKSLISQYLESCLAYLEVNQRQLAMGEVENCLMIDQKDVDILILRAFLSWSMLEEARGYKEFWIAYSIQKNHPEVQIFLQMITPEIEKLYKEAKYDLIDRKLQKCKLKVKKGLQIHPFHTNFLILSAYLHRMKEEYEHALANLQLANKTLEDKELEEELRNQISLTYNEMGIYLFKQSKHNEAITLFTEGLTFKTRDWGMLVNRADCYRALNQYVRALEDYLKAYEIQKKNQELNFRISSIYSIRGVSLFNSKNFQLALREFEESLKFSPKCAQFHLSKSKCLLQLNRKNEAVSALEESLHFDQKLLQATQLLEQLKDPEDKKNPKNQRKIIFLSKQK